MLQLSSLSVTLLKSSHFLKITLLIYGFTAYVLWNSAFPLGLKVLCFLVLYLHGYWLWRVPPCYFSCRQIRFQTKKWFLKDNRPALQETGYEKIRILLEAGLFFLIEFSAPSSKTLRLVFFDQLTREEYRRIKLLEKIS